MPVRASAMERANAKWGEGGGLVDASGKPMRGDLGVSSLGGGGGGDEMNFKLTLPQRVRNVEIGLGVLAAAGALAFWFVMERMDGRFDRVDDRTREISRDLGNFSTDTARNFERILVRLPDDQSERGTGARQARPVREGTGSDR